MRSASDHYQPRIAARARAHLRSHLDRVPGRRPSPGNPSSSCISGATESCRVTGRPLRGLLLYMRHVERSAFVRALMFARARPVSSCSLPQITSLDYCFSSVTLHILTGLSTLFSSLVTCVEPSSPPSHFSVTSVSCP